MDVPDPDEALTYTQEADFGKAMATDERQHAKMFMEMTQNKAPWRRLASHPLAAGPRMS